jgi:hypothetical protein
MELAERGRRCRRYDEWIDHITECPVCRETYKQLLHAELAVRAAQHPTRTMALRFWLPAAAAAMLILFFGARALFSGGVETMGLRQQNGEWYEGALRLPDWAASAAAQFAAPPTSPLRSDNTPTQHPITLTTPDPANRALENTTPEFRWKSTTGTVRYRAWLEAADGSQKIVLRVHDTRAALPASQKLRSGRSYRLIIEALAPNELPGEGLSSVYEFYVLTPEERTHLHWAREHRMQAPRTCAMIFYQLGFYTEALDTLSRLPDEPLVRAWRETIQAQLTTQ